ncbi:SusC/RagA family TonB-linked outer membrane protein [Chryseobacterium mucoviscidosis]|uniref:SusC/RagA family TonB-linked outer membrane protein n=1 Tax=Chryseobacterium mucoviscidosis TaxID=1945581 RepID=UPI0031D576FD
MKKLTTGILILVLSSSLAIANAQQKKNDTVRTQEIEGVVVTALGIKREKKALGYATSQVGGGDLQKSGETNVIQGLAGKVAGVQVTGTAGTPGASSKIVIRGQKSIELSSQPLIVLDGQIIDNSYNNNAGSGTNIGGVDDSNRAVDINPDDIESVNVLKGGAAAALYGEGARNGVIIYVSKKGRKRKGIGIDFSTTVGYDMLSNMINLQKTYAAGTNGVAYIDPAQYGSDGFPLTGGTNQSWGPLISSVSGLKAYDNVKNFYQTGVTNNYNLALSGGGENGNFRASFGHLNQTGIVPNTSLKKTSFNINSEYKFTEQLKVGGDFLYSNTTGIRAQKGSNVSGIMLSLLRMPSTYDVRDYQTAQGYNKNYFSAYDNPFYTVYNNPYTDETNRVIFNGHINYNYSKSLNAIVRAGVDTYTTHAQQNYSFSSNGNSTADGTGQVILDTFTKSLYNLDLIFNGIFDITDNINLNYNIGGQINSTFFNDQYSVGSTMLEINQYNLSNFSNYKAQNADYKQIRRGVFGSLEFSFYDQVYLTLTGRNDWNSALPKQNNSYFYPSISASWLFNKTLGLPSWVNLGKIRASYASTYAAPLSYNVITPYITPLFTDSFGPQLTSPYNSVGAYGFSTILRNSNLKPEHNKEFEIGLELEMFKRLHLNASAYKSTNYDLLITLPIAPSSGYSTYYTNGPSVENKGLEVSLGYDIFKKENFSWDFTLNWAMNRNKVVDLNGVPDNSAMGSDYFSGNLTPTISLGQPLGVFYGSAYRRDNSGNLIIGSDGLPILSAEYQLIGNPNPDWTGGFRNNLRYKNLSLSFLLDFRKGGDIWNGTLARLNRLGMTQASAENRSGTYVIPGVLEDGSPNNIAISNKTYYVSYLGDGSGSANETAIEKDINWLRLRDVTLSYNFSKVISQSMGLSFVKNAELSLSARNLFLITNYKGIDPENSFAGSSSNTQGFDYFNNPNTRSYYLTFKFGF